MEQFDDFIASAIKANRELYKKVSSPLDPLYFESGSVGAGGDVSFGIDIMAEEIFVKHLEKFGRIDSEECGMIGSGEYTITIDPIDGSDNFKSGLPYFASSIALEKDGDVKVGIVANLADGTLFLKTKSSFKRTKIDSDKFEEIELNPHASVGIFERAYRSEKYAKKFKDSSFKYRSLGAVALSLAYTNQVQFFVYEGQMRTYDVKAGLFMCEGLYQHKEKDLTIICQQLNCFEKLKRLLL